MDLNHILLV